MFIFGPHLFPGHDKPRKADKPKKEARNCSILRFKVLQVIQAVKSKNMTIGEAAKHFKIHKNTICDRISSRRTNFSWDTTELMVEEEENIILQRLEVMGERGFP